MNAPVKFGILGYARIAKQQLIPAMLAAKNAIPYAIASGKPEKLREAQNTFNFQKAYSDYDSLLKDPDVDAVYIPLPNHLHKEWTIKAARAGKHVLCEKPLALSEEDIQEMASVCRECGVMLMEAFMFRFSARTKKVSELIASGAVGEVRHISSSFRFVMDRTKDIRLNPEMGGGSLWDVGCYPVNIIGMIMKDEPDKVAAVKTDLNGVDLSLSAVLKYKNGALCTVHSGFDSKSAQLTEINGTEGTLIIRDSFDQTDTPILLIKNGVTEEIPVPACERYVLEVESFSNSVLENKEPFFSMEETLRNNRLILRIQKAAL